MSTVRLQAFSILKPSPQISEKFEIVHGASAIRRNSDAEGKEFTEVLLDSVPFRLPSFTQRIGSISKNKGGLYFLYGIRDSLDETSFWSAEARKDNAVLTTVELEYDIRAQYPGLVDRKILKEFRNEAGESIGFLNSSRLKRSLLLELLSKFQEIVKEEDGNLLRMQSVRDMATRPDLWAHVMTEDEDLKKVDVIVVPVADIEPGTRQVAWVRPMAKVVSTMQSRTDIELLNPSWMEVQKPKSKVKS